MGSHIHFVFHDACHGRPLHTGCGSSKPFQGAHTIHGTIVYLPTFTTKIKQIQSIFSWLDSTQIFAQRYAMDAT